MVANINSMAFYGATPWHRTGTKINEDVAYSVEDMIDAAGLNWRADKVPLFQETQENVPDEFWGEGADHRVYKQVTGMNAVRRDDNQEILGYVGDRYEILQNEDALGWFQPFLDAKEAKFETAGALGNGSRVWAMARLNRDPMEIVPGDPVEKFILLSHSHDGSLSVRVGFTPIRVVCQNTLSMAHSNKGSKLIRFKHSRSIKVNLETIRETMNLANQEFEATAEQFRLLARKDINQNDLMKYIKLVLKVDPNEKLPKKTIGVMERIMDRFENGRGHEIPGVKGTYWAAYNAVTEWLSWDRGQTEESRLNSLWYGANNKTNADAIKIAVDMVTAA